MLKDYIVRDDEDQIAFASMLISVAFTLGVGIAIALLGYFIVFSILYALMTMFGISEIVAFTIAYSFGCGWCYATLLGYAFQADRIYQDVYEALNESIIPTVVDTVNSWTGWIYDNAAYYVTGVVAAFAPTAANTVEGI